MTSAVVRLMNAVWSRRKELVRFFIGGLVSVGTALSVTTLAHEIWEMPTQTAGALGFVGALLVNFLMLRGFIFRDHSGRFREQVTGYLSAALTFRSLEYGVYYVLSGLAAMQYQVAMVVVMVASSLLKFFVYDKLVFRRRHPAA